MLRLLTMIWACPGTAVGLLAGLLGVVTGGRMRRVGRTLEFHGGCLRWVLDRWPFRAAAMTLGHVIVARDKDCLDVSREHELVHVRQYERWGPLFIPAYLGSSAWQWLRGRHPYWDNPFEREAYAADGRHCP